MIQQILDRLQTIGGVTVREGFYAQSVAREQQFIFLQPFNSTLKNPGGGVGYQETLQLQIVGGIKLPTSATPTADLINLSRAIRSALFKDQRDPARPNWLPGGYAISESEPCKFIMPEAHEQHGLAVITLSISTSPKFGDRL